MLERGLKHRDNIYKIKNESIYDNKLSDNYIINKITTIDKEDNRILDKKEIKDLQEHVKPIQYTKIKDVYIEKYQEYLESTFEQILDALGINFDELVGRPHQTGLGVFFTKKTSDT
jgi:hypothetical protein